MPGCKQTITAMIVALALMAMPASQPPLVSNVRADGVSALPWRLQGMQAWGRDNVAVDYGARGLWSYNGGWVQLSRLDPENMVSWGEGNLAVDFGVHGLWTYDGRSWLKISR